MTTREVAKTVWAAALAAGDVAPLVRRHLSVNGSALTAGGLTLDLNRLQRILVLGVGKAAAAMARAVEGILGDRVTEGFVVVKDGYRVETARIEVAEAGHPVPDTRGLEASGRLLTLAASANERDLVLVLVSGGGSALTPAPADPITLAEKQTLTRLLLEGGATIGELNAVRKHLSRLKGGLLARAAHPATVVTLALSDVVGDALDVIASGPTSPDPSTYGDALEVLEARGVLERAPRAIVERLRAGARGAIEETPKPGDRVFERVRNVVIGNNTILRPSVKVYADTEIGSGCELHSGSIIGSDGFGFAPQADGSYKTIPQLGNVIIKDNVTVGANTVIDCATLLGDSTIVHQGVKLDNLIQIAHNVEIGKNTVIAAQAGISGSSKVGENSMVGGQVGIAGHLVLANNTSIGAQAGIAKSVKDEGQRLIGYPAFDVKEYFKSYAIFKRLPSIFDRLSELEKKVNGTESGGVGNP